MQPLRGKGVQILLLVVSTSALAAAQEPSAKPSAKPSQKDDAAAGKKYREQEPPFQPPPLPIQRSLQVESGAEHPPSFFQSQVQPQKIESRQFNGQQLEQQQPQQFQQTSFNAFQEQPQRDQFQNRQQQSFDQAQFQQFNPQPQQQQQPQQNFQFPQGQQSFQDPNNFQSRQQETFPTLPPVFIPPNQPIGPAPALQSPIRNLFREPEPPFSLSGIFQRFLRLFNLNN